MGLGAWDWLGVARRTQVADYLGTEVAKRALQ